MSLPLQELREKGAGRAGAEHEDAHVVAKTVSQGSICSGQRAARIAALVSEAYTNRVSDLCRLWDRQPMAAEATSRWHRSGMRVWVETPGPPPAASKFCETVAWKGAMGEKAYFFVCARHPSIRSRAFVFRRQRECEILTHDITRQIRPADY